MDSLGIVDGKNRIADREGMVYLGIGKGNI